MTLILRLSKGLHSVDIITRTIEPEGKSSMNLLQCDMSTAEVDRVHPTHFLYPPLNIFGPSTLRRLLVQAQERSDGQAFSVCTSMLKLIKVL